MTESESDAEKMVRQRKTISKTFPIESGVLNTLLSDAFESLHSSVDGCNFSQIEFIATPNESRLIGEVNVTTDRTEVFDELSRIGASEYDYVSPESVSSIKFVGHVSADVTGQKSDMDGDASFYDYTVTYETDTPQREWANVDSLEEYAEMVADGDETTVEDVLQQDTYYGHHHMSVPAQKRKANNIVRQTIRDRIQNQITVNNPESIDIGSRQLYLDEDKEQLEFTVTHTPPER